MSNLWTEGGDSVFAQESPGFRARTRHLALDLVEAGKEIAALQAQVVRLLLRPGYVVDWDGIAARARAEEREACAMVAATRAERAEEALRDAEGEAEFDRAMYVAAKDRADRAEASCAAMRLALEQELLQWSAEGSWCTRCRTSCDNEVVDLDRGRRRGTPHPHAAHCPLSSSAGSDLLERLRKAEESLADLEAQGLASHAILCAYCEELVARASVQAHIAECPRHPVAKLLAKTTAIEAERDTARAEVEALRAQKDGAYSERNRVVALLARMARKLGWAAGIAQHPALDVDWEDDWRTIVFIDLPTGQASWHFQDMERSLLDGLPPYGRTWDGHTTEEKYGRVERALSPSPTPEDK